MPATLTKPATFRWFIRPVKTPFGIRFQPVCRWADGAEIRPGRTHRTEAYAREYIRREFRGGQVSPTRTVLIAEGWE